MRAGGVIKGITVNIDFRQLNYSQQVLIGVKLPHGHIEPFLKEAYKVEGVTDIIHTTGEFCFFVGITYLAQMLEKHPLKFRIQSILSLIIWKFLMLSNRL